MQSTAKHIGLFRRVYNFAPCGNVTSSVMVCIGNTTTVFATKAFPFSFTNPKAISTHLRSVSRWDNKQFNTFQLGFVSQILTKLVETPTVQFCFQCLAFWLCCFADIAQIFNGNSLVFTYCFFYNLLCYGMVVNGNEPTLSTTKPFQEFFSSLSAFALNAGSYFRILLTNLFKLFGVEISAIGQGTYVRLSKVATDKFFNVFYFFFWDFNGLEQVKLSFFKYQIRFAFYVRQIIGVMTNKLNPLQPAIDRPQRNSIFGIGKYASIVSNCAKYAKLSFTFFVKFVGIHNFRNATDYHLGRKIERRFYRIVNLSMQLKLIEKFLVPSRIRNYIASCIRLYQSIFERSKLLLCRQKFYLQSQFHSTKIQNNFIYLTNNFLTKGERQFLPSTPKDDEWVSLPKNL